MRARALRKLGYEVTITPINQLAVRVAVHVFGEDFRRSVIAVIATATPIYRRWSAALKPNVVVEFEALYQFQEIHAANYSRRVL